MFSISKRSLHENVEHGLLAAGNSMCWTTPQCWILLLAQDHGTISSSARLWNPCLGDKLPLPDIGEEHQMPYHCRCLLSNKDPTHPGCVIVLFNDAAPDLWYCHTAGGGDNSSSPSWRHYSYNIGSDPSSIPKPPKGKKGTPPLPSSSYQGYHPLHGFHPRENLYFTNSAGMCVIDFSSALLPRQIITTIGLRSIISMSLRSISPKDCPQVRRGWLSHRINSF